MWSDVRRFAELQSRGRWKVEFFSGQANTQPDAAYPLLPLRELVAERKEFIDPQQHSQRKFDYLGLENVESHTGDLVDFAPKPGSDVKSRSKVFHAGDVLYGRLRPNLNKVYVAAGPVADGICSGEFYVLTPETGSLEPRYLRAVLASRLVQEHVATWLTGAALPRLQLSDLIGLSIPVPPLDIQQSIARLIEACDERRRQCKRIVEHLPAIVHQCLIANVLDGEALPSKIDVEAIDAWISERA